MASRSTKKKAKKTSTKKDVEAIAEGAGVGASGAATVDRADGVRRAAAKADDPLAAFFVSEEERLLLARSYVSGSGRRVDASEMHGLLCFWVAHEQYAVGIEAIQEIIKVPEITPVPRVEAMMLGVISLRGTIVPVLDLRRVLHLEPTPITREARIVVLSGGDDPVGLLTDRVSSVVRLEESAVEAAPMAIKQVGAGELVMGVGRIADEMLILLDVDGLLSLLERAA